MHHSGRAAVEAKTPKNPLRSLFPSPCFRGKRPRARGPATGSKYTTSPGLRPFQPRPRRIGPSIPGRIRPQIPRPAAALALACLLAGCLALAAAVAQAENVQTDRPNIVVFVSDDHGRQFTGKDLEGVSPTFASTAQVGSGNPGPRVLGSGVCRGLSSRSEAVCLGHARCAEASWFEWKVYTNRAVCELKQRSRKAFRLDCWEE